MDESPVDFTPESPVYQPEAGNTEQEPSIEAMRRVVEELYNRQHAMEAELRNERAARHNAEAARN